MKAVFTLITAMCLLCGRAAAGAFTGSSENKRLLFIENKGQVTDQYHQPRPDIDYMLNAAPGLSVFIGKGNIHYQFYTTSTGPDKEKEYTYKGYRLDVELVGANPNAEVKSFGKTAFHQSFFNRHMAGKTAIANSCSELRFTEIYPGVDWRIFIANGHVKYEFILQPGADAAAIKIRYKGAKKLHIDREGALVAQTPMGLITEDAPVCFEDLNGQMINVKSRFVLKGNVLTYQVPTHKGRFVIDPSLMWSTYYGGSAEEASGGIAYDGKGGLYTTGNTGSPSNIATIGNHQPPVVSFQKDVYLAKFDTAGTLLWGLYYGGDGFEMANAITTDKAGFVYISGYTTSDTGISTPGCHQPAMGAPSHRDAFLTKVDSDGAIVWGTYYGGFYDETGYGVGVDSAGNVYMGGETASTTDISTAGSFQPAKSGASYYSDLFLVKFNSDGVRLWGTYFGSAYNEMVGHLAVDDTGTVYISGRADGGGLATPGAFQSVTRGNGDVLLARFSPDGQRQWATYMGSYSYDHVFGMVLDRFGYLYLTGNVSDNGMATPGVSQTVLGGTNDAYLCRFASNGHRSWYTYYGGTGGENGFSVCTDTAGGAFIAGGVTSPDSIATPFSYQPVSPNAFVSYVAHFDSTGQQLWGTYWGKYQSSQAYGVAADNEGYVYVTGATIDSTSFSTPGSHQPFYGGAGDAYVTKFNPCHRPNPGTISCPDALICPNATTQFTDTSGNGYWSIDNANAASINQNGLATGIGPGNVLVTYALVNACGESTTNTSLLVNSAPAPAIVPGGNITVCEGDSLTLTGSGNGMYLWSDGTTGNTLTVTQSGIYNLSATDSVGCIGISSPVTVNVVFPDTPNIIQTGNLLSTTAVGTYQWYFNNQLLTGDTLPVYTLTQAGDYYVVVNNNGCAAPSVTFAYVINGLPDNRTGNLILYPNLTSGLVSLTGASVASLQLFNSAGQLVKTFNSTNIISLNDLSAGLYLLQAIDASGKILGITKLIKQ